MLRRMMMAGAAAGGGAHLYWRINISARQSSTYSSLAEVEMRATAGGADLCSGGTASADSFYSGAYVPANAFDNSAASVWASGGTEPHWIRYQFAAPVTIAEVMLQAPPASYGGLPEQAKDFTIEHSDDGSAWTVAKTVTAEPAWTAGEVRLYSVP